MKKRKGAGKDKSPAKASGADKARGPESAFAKSSL
jgi:hypothetical protein